MIERKTKRLSCQGGRLFLIQVSHRLEFIHFAYMKPSIFNKKPHIHARILHAIDTGWILLIRRPGILGQNLKKRIPVLYGYEFQTFGRAVYLQAVTAVPAAEPSFCFGVTVHIR